MRSAVAVIGANFGDEGKGLITDFEARRLNSKVVARCNGGAQAGHTVVTPDGDRHVFGHHGAGTFAGADTYLSSQFLVNPLVFANERQQLGDKATKVFVHPNARVSTIYDMVLNTLVESQRGAQRHGSCGLGINETVTRHYAGFGITFSDLKFGGVKRVALLMKRIHRMWVPKRLLELGISLKDSVVWYNTAVQDIILEEDYEHHATALIESAKDMTIGVTGLLPVETVVIEGAQGLALDEELGEFPHVTRSITGLQSSIGAAWELGMDSVTPVYVTRCYLTRHGAGPLQYEGVSFTKTPLHDITNVHNEWQGSLRYAPLNLPQLKEFITKDFNRGDLTRNKSIQVIRPHLAVTCLDQVGDEVTVIGMTGDKITIPVESADLYIADQLGITLSHSSRGPCANDVRLHTIAM